MASQVNLSSSRSRIGAKARSKDKLVSAIQALITETTASVNLTAAKRSNDSVSQQLVQKDVRMSYSPPHSATITANASTASLQQSGASDELSQVAAEYLDWSSTVGLRRDARDVDGPTPDLTFDVLYSHAAGGRDHEAQRTSQSSLPIATLDANGRNSAITQSDHNASWAHWMQAPSRLEVPLAPSDLSAQRSLGHLPELQIRQEQVLSPASESTNRSSLAEKLPCERPNSTTGRRTETDPGSSPLRASTYKSRRAEQRHHLIAERRYRTGLQDKFRLLHDAVNQWQQDEHEQDTSEMCDTRSSMNKASVLMGAVHCILQLREENDHFFEQIESLIDAIRMLQRSLVEMREHARPFT